MATAVKLLFLITALFAILVSESCFMVLARKAEQDVDRYPLNEEKYSHGSLRRYQCPSQCNRRCLQTRYKKPCLFFCNKCCNTCLCVPPGYYGNKGACPCYNNWKTKRGGPKCP